MRFPGCAKVTIDAVTYFQFSLWDSSILKIFDNFFTRSFNSLYEIQLYHLNQCRIWKFHFQFSLWDSRLLYIDNSSSNSDLSILFMRFLYQSNLLFWLNHFPFNSLYEILHNFFDPSFFYCLTFNSLYEIQ